MSDEEPVAHSLGPELLYRMEHMTALLAQNVVAQTMAATELTVEQVAALAAELAAAIANEVRRYKVVDNKMMKTDG